MKNSRVPDSPSEPKVRLSAASGPEQVSIWSWSTVTVHEATNGLPATIRSQRSSTGTTRASSTVRWGWSCMQSRHWTTASWISSTRSAASPLSGSTLRIAS